MLPTDDLVSLSGTLNVSCRLTDEILGTIEFTEPGAGPDRIIACRRGGAEGSDETRRFGDDGDSVAWIVGNPAIPRPGPRRPDIVKNGTAHYKCLARLPSGAMLALPLSAPVNICALQNGQIVARIRKTALRWSVGSMTGDDLYNARNLKSLAEAIGYAIAAVKAECLKKNDLSGHEELAWRELETMFASSEDEPVSGFVRDIEQTLTKPVAGSAFSTRIFA